MKPIIILLFLILTCFPSIAQTDEYFKNDLQESRKYTFGFINNLLLKWNLIYTDTSVSIKDKLKCYNNYLSSQELEKDNKHRLELNRIIEKQNGQISFLNTDLGKHEVNIKLPITFKDRNYDLVLKFIRIKTNNIYSWRITDIRMGDSCTLINNGIKYIEFEKDFSNTIEEIMNKKNISQYFDINPYYNIFLDNYNYISLKSRNIDSIYYKITELPYFNKKNEIIGYKFLILTKNRENKNSRKQGWHILDEGEMNEYYNKYEESNIINFYLKKIH